MQKEIATIYQHAQQVLAALPDFESTSEYVPARRGPFEEKFTPPNWRMIEEMLPHIEPAALAPLIDHTLLKPEATRIMITRLCEEALQYSFASVCVNPFWVPLCADLLKDSKILVCTVTGFPLGATATTLKVAEAQNAVYDGADEIDMVLNIGAVKAGEWNLAYQDMKKVVQAAVPAKVKVIIETCLLNEEEKIFACLLCQKAGAHFVKTSTGFSHSGAVAADVALMRQVVGPEMGVKAAGGIRNYPTALQMLIAGANRIGSSAGVAMVNSEGL